MADRQSAQGGVMAGWPRSQRLLVALAVLLTALALALAAIVATSGSPNPVVRSAAVSAGTRGTAGSSVAAANESRRPAPDAKEARPEAVAAAFFASYVAFSYGRPGARITGASGVLTARLEGERPEVPASIQTLDPRIAELLVEPLTQTRWTALAVVEDGRSRYTLLATLALRNGAPRVVAFEPWG